MKQFRTLLEDFARVNDIDLTDAFEVNEIEENDVIEYYIKSQINTSDATLFLVEDIGSGNEAVEFEDIDAALEYYIDNVIDDFVKGDDLALIADDEELLTYNYESHKYIKEFMQFIYKYYDQLEDEDYQEKYKSLTAFAQLLEDYQASAYKVSQVTKIPQSTLSRYVRAEANIADATALNIYKVSKYFDLTVEQFLERMGVI